MNTNRTPTSISHELVEQAAREVLETTASRRVVAAACHQPDGAFHGLIATLFLGGARGGTLVVYCRRELAATVAAGMLGVTSDPTAAETLEDALGELANQIAGTIKRKLGGDGITLSVPVVIAGGPLSHMVKSRAAPVAVDLQLEQGSCCVCLWPADNQAAPAAALTDEA